MPLFDIYSKRKKKQESKKSSDPYSYNNIPEAFRIQVSHILSDTLGPYGQDRWQGRPYPANKYWEIIKRILCKEYGVFQLDNGDYNTKYECLNFLLKSETDKVLDIIEISFRLIDNMSDYDVEQLRSKQTPEDAIKELNERFFEHNLGYQYTEGIIIRMDSEHLHKEVIVPVIKLLKSNKFEGAIDEFMKAHEYYKKGNNKDAISWALKSFESTMKTICLRNGWKIGTKQNASNLIEICFENELIPKALTSQFASIRALLESGVPTIRNKMGAHGQGEEIVAVPDFLASFALNITAANIILLIKADEKKV